LIRLIHNLKIDTIQFCKFPLVQDAVAEAAGYLDWNWSSPDRGPNPAVFRFREPAAGVPTDDAVE